MTDCRLCGKPLDLAPARNGKDHDQCMGAADMRMDNGICVHCGDGRIQPARFPCCASCTDTSKNKGYPGP